MPPTFNDFKKLPAFNGRELSKYFYKSSSVDAKSIRKFLFPHKDQAQKERGGRHDSVTNRAAQSRTQAWSSCVSVLRTSTFHTHVPKQVNDLKSCAEIIHHRKHMFASMETPEMKKTLVTLAVAAATGAAFAQSSVTISGGLAAAYERYGIAGDAQLSSYGTDSNFIYFKGTEDLGGGLKVSFDLQKRFNLDTGVGNGKEFENSFITVDGKFGAMKVGRHQAISVAKYDIFGGSGSNATNAGTAAAYYAYNNVSGSRYDDAISYTTPNFNGFKATAVTTLNPAVNTEREATAVSFNYDKGPLSLAAVVEQTAAATIVAKRTDKNIGASYDFGMAKALLLWGQEGSAKSRTTVGVIVPVGKAVKLMASYRTEGETVSTAGVVTTTKANFALGAEYDLSKRTQLFAHYGDSDSLVQAAYRVGLKHLF